MNVILLLLLFISVVSGEICTQNHYVLTTYPDDQGNAYDGTECKDIPGCEKNCTADSSCTGFLTNIIQPIFSAGTHTNMVALADGTYRGWGVGVNNAVYGNIVSGATNDPPRSFNVGKIIKAGSGWQHGCVLIEGGSVRCWGNNKEGQCGVSTNYDTQYSVFISQGSFPLPSGKKAVLISVGRESTCIYLDDESFICVGENNGGETAFPLPYGEKGWKQRTSTLWGGNIIAFSSGMSKFRCAIYNGGGVKCSGHNYQGTLGDGQTVENYGRWNSNLVQPIGIDGSTDDKSAVSICTGYGHACILTKSQKMMCWGANDMGQVSGSPHGRYVSSGSVYGRIKGTPFEVDLGGTKVKQISCDSHYTCALLVTGELKCWGNNFCSNCGYNANPSTKLNGVGYVYVSVTSVCARLLNNSLSCFGGQYPTSNTFQQIPLSGKNVSSEFVGKRKDFECTSCGSEAENAAGDDTANGATSCLMKTACGHNFFVNTSYQCEACAPLTYNDPGDKNVGTCTDTEKCIGSNVVVKGVYDSDTSVKYGNNSCNSEPICKFKCNNDASCLGYSGNSYTRIYAGEQNILAVNEKNEVLTAGYVGYRLGDKDHTQTSYVWLKANLPADKKFNVIFTDGRTKFFISDDYKLYGQGYNADYQMHWHTGYQTLTVNGAYYDPIFLEDDVMDVASDTKGVTCVIKKSNKRIQCWGHPNANYLIEGGYRNPAWHQWVKTPTDAKVAAQWGYIPAVKIVMGDYIFCALLNTGEVACASNWGGYVGERNSVHGYGASFLPNKIIDVAATNRETFCALVDNGKVYCWGYNYAGELATSTGIGTWTSYKTPRDVGVTDAIAISQGHNRDGFCVITSQKKIVCWGANYYNRFDAVKASSDKITTPTEIDQSLPAGRTPVQLTLGNTLCVLMDNNRIHCFPKTTKLHVNNDPGTNIATPFVGQYGPLVTGNENSYTKRISCGTCPAGASSSATYLDTANGITSCVSSTACGQDEYMTVDYQCEGCPGTFNDAGDTSPGLCDDTQKCRENHYVKISYNNDENKYGNTTCISDTDCEEKCSTSACDGYTTIKRHQVISGGSLHLCFLLNDGSVKCQGTNNWSKQLGLDTGNTASVTSNTPITDVTSISSGHSSTCAIKSDKTLMCWGGCTSGECGDGSYTALATPTAGCSWCTVNNVEKVSCGSTNCAILKEDGTVQVRGRGSYGAWGTGSTSSRGYSWQTPHGASPAKLVHVGHMGQVCAIGTNNTLMCWGNNEKGSLGLGHTSNQLKPAIVDLGNDVAVDIACGYQYCCIVVVGGNVRCSGEGYDGRTGYESTNDRSTYGPNVKLPSGKKAKKVRISEKTTYVHFTDKTATAWGYNHKKSLGWKQSGNVGDNSGEMGDNLGLLFDGASIDYIEAQGNSRAAVLSNGTIMVWGEQSGGQGNLDSSFTNIYPPEQLNLGKPVAAVFEGYYGVVVGSGLGKKKSIECASCGEGINEAGDDVLLGATTCVRSTPCQQDYFVSADDYSCQQCPTNTYNDPGDKTPKTCDDLQKCYGSNMYVKVSYSDASNTRYAGKSCIGDADCSAQCAVDNSCIGYTVENKVPLALEHSISCALLSNGDVKCWGTAIGYSPQLKFTSVMYLGGGSAICAILTDGSVKCLGFNFYGAVGTNQQLGTTNRVTTPQTVNVGTGKKAVILGGSNYHTCAGLDDGSIVCWGTNNRGQFGNGATSSTTEITPQTVNSLGAGRTAVALSNGLSHGHQCAILDNGSVKCWGYNSRGQLGDNSTTDRHTPTDVVGIDGSTDAKTAVGIASGESFTCAVMKNGDLKCWGLNNVGQLGDGTTTDRHTPVTASLPAGRTAVSVACTRVGTYVIFDDGSVKFVGKNNEKSGGCGSSCDTSRAFSTWQDIDLGSGRTALFIRGGDRYGCAVLDDQSLKCWGNNYHGKLGDGTSTDRSTPVSVNLGSNVTTMKYEQYGTSVSGEGRSFTKQLSCDQCPTGTTSSSSILTVANGATSCTLATGCGQDEFVAFDHTCQPCVPGTFNDPGDKTIGSCDDDEVCPINHRVLNKKCVPCEMYETRNAGDDAGGQDTTCMCKFLHNSVCYQCNRDTQYLDTSTLTCKNATTTCAATQVLVLSTVPFADNTCVLRTKCEDSTKQLINHLCYPVCSSSTYLDISTSTCKTLTSSCGKFKRLVKATNQYSDNQCVYITPQSSEVTKTLRDLKVGHSTDISQKIVDYDNDGILDVVYFRSGSKQSSGLETINVYINSGSNTNPIFTKKIAYGKPTSKTIEAIKDILILDITYDGILDMVVVGHDTISNGVKSGSYIVLKGNGTHLEATTNVLTDLRYPIYAIDVNNDGKLDLCGSGAQEGVICRTSNGDGTFTYNSAYRGQCSTGKYGSVAFHGDVSVIQLNDKNTCTQDEHRLEVYNVKTSSHRFVLSPAVTEKVNDVSFVDFDNDGDDEMCILTDNELVIYSFTLTTSTSYSKVEDVFSDTTLPFSNVISTHTALGDVKTACDASSICVGYQYNKNASTYEALKGQIMLRNFTGSQFFRKETSTTKNTVSGTKVANYVPCATCNKKLVNLVAADIRKIGSKQLILVDDESSLSSGKIVSVNMSNISSSDIHDLNDFLPSIQDDLGILSESSFKSLVKKEGGVAVNAIPTSTTLTMLTVKHPLYCGANERAVAGVCETCPSGSKSPGVGSPADTPNTGCERINDALCLENEYVRSGKCFKCTNGETNAAGDNMNGGETKCACTNTYGNCYGGFAPYLGTCAGGKAIRCSEKGPIECGGAESKCESSKKYFYNSIVPTCKITGQCAGIPFDAGYTEVERAIPYDTKLGTKSWGIPKDNSITFDDNNNAYYLKAYDTHLSYNQYYSTGIYMKYRIMKMDPSGTETVVYSADTKLFPNYGIAYYDNALYFYSCKYISKYDLGTNTFTEQWGSHVPSGCDSNYDFPSFFIDDGYIYAHRNVVSGSWHSTCQGTSLSSPCYSQVVRWKISDKGTATLDSSSFLGFGKNVRINKLKAHGGKWYMHADSLFGHTSGKSWSSGLFKLTTATWPSSSGYITSDIGSGYYYINGTDIYYPSGGKMYRRGDTQSATAVEIGTLTSYNMFKQAGNTAIHTKLDATGLYKTHLVPGTRETPNSGDLRSCTLTKESGCLCNGNEYASGGVCYTCPEGATANLNNYNPALGDTVCLCQGSMSSDGTICSPCEDGKRNNLKDYDPRKGVRICFPSYCPRDYHVVDGKCVECPSNSQRLPGDDPSGPDTKCHCPINSKVINGECYACEQGSSNPKLCYASKEGGDTYCTCHENYHSLANKTCVPCPANSINGPGDYAGNGASYCQCKKDYRAASGFCLACPANSNIIAGSKTNEADTFCRCQSDYYSEFGTCNACPANSYNDAPTDTNVNSKCKCKANFKVKNKVCVACELTSTRNAGSLIGDVDTYCTCGANEKVKNHTCVACETGGKASAGSNSAGFDTECSCGVGYEKNNSVCVACPAGTASTGNDSPCVCKPNHYVQTAGSCVACPTGTESDGGNSYQTVSSCKLKAGFYVDTNGDVKTCPTGSTSNGGQLINAGETKCKTIANYYVDTAGEAQACPANSAVGGGVTLETRTSISGCICNKGFQAVGTNCGACPAGQTTAGDHRTNDTQKSCFCKEGFYVDDVANECKACGTGGSVAEGGDPNGASTSCDCAQNYRVNAAGNCEACPVGTTNAPYDKTQDGETQCDVTKCASNQRVQSNACVSCPSGMVNAAGDLANGTNTVCDYIGETSKQFEFDVSGSNYLVQKKDGTNLGTNPTINVRIGSGPFVFSRQPASVAGNDLVIASEVVWTTQDTDYASYTKVDVGESKDDVSVINWNPTVPGTYYYLSKDTSTMVGKIEVSLPLCSISTSGTVTLQNSCVMANEVILTGDLEVQIASNRRRHLLQTSGSLHLKAASNKRHFTVPAGKKLTVKSMTLTDGNPGDAGGAILASGGSVVVDNVVFKNNAATTGGAIEAEKDQANNEPSLDIKGATFDGNEGTNGGGAINAKAGTFVVEASTFKNNKANTGNGGAILSTTDVTVKSSTFEANAAPTGDGGAIIVQNKRLVMEATTLKANSAKNGGAMKIKGGSADLRTLIIESNNATTDGGALMIDESDVNITSSNLKGNAGANGGGIKTRNMGGKKMKAESSTFENNKGRNGGGAFHFEDEANTDMVIKGSTFTNNKGSNDESDDMKSTGNTNKVVKVVDLLSQISRKNMKALNCTGIDCSHRPNSSGKVVGSICKCECDGVNHFLQNEKCTAVTVCKPGDVTVVNATATSDKICGSPTIAQKQAKFDAAGAAMSSLITNKLKESGLGDSDAFNLAVDVLGGVNKC